MNTVELECPNCGAGVALAEREHIGICPYCGSKVCLDNAGNAVLLQKLEKEIEQRDMIDQNEEAHKKRLKNWYKWAYIIIGSDLILSFLGWYLTGTERSVAVGSVSMLMSLLFAVMIPIFLMAAYPCREVMKGKEITRTPKRSAVLLKLYGIEVPFLITSVLAAYIVAKAVG